MSGYYEAPIREPLIIGHKTYHDITEDIARPIEERAGKLWWISTGALKFGDMNDKSSGVRALFNDKRKYVLLEEIGTKPNVFYHTKIRNRKENNV